MTDYSELKRLAEACQERPDEYEWYAPDGGYGLDTTDLAFISAAKPAAVLALIADNESRKIMAAHWLRQAHNLYQENTGLRSSLDTLALDCDQLRAEVEALRESDQESTVLCDTLSALLGKVALVVRGPEEPKSRHGFHDLPSRVKAVVEERDHLSAVNFDLCMGKTEAEKEIARLKSELKSMTVQRDSAIDLAILRKRERDEARVRVEALRKDAARLDRLEMECEAYGTDVHEGNRWVVDGPFATVRDAIDAAMTQDRS